MDEEARDEAGFYIKGSHFGFCFFGFAYPPYRPADDWRFFLSLCRAQEHLFYGSGGGGFLFLACPDAS